MTLLKDWALWTLSKGVLVGDVADGIACQYGLTWKVELGPHGGHGRRRVGCRGSTPRVYFENHGLNLSDLERGRPVFSTHVYLHVERRTTVISSARKGA